MSIEVCVLASGSQGNCTALRTPGGVMLVDAGIGPRVAAQRLAGTGVAAADVAAICLTHLDRDHFNYNWVGSVVEHGVRVFCHAGRVDELLGGVARATAGRFGGGGDRDFAPLVEGFSGSTPFAPLDGLTAYPIALAHDWEGSHGFVFDGFDARVGYATDLGRVPNALLEFFEGVDVLALESNYDAQMQLGSGRPAFLQRRIMGGRGHLSNQQAFEAVKGVLDRCQRNGAPLPAHVVLLHRSLQCNCPEVVRKLFSRDARIGPRLTLAEQYERTAWLGAADRRAFEGEQLMLAWG